jgi:hypothetical protein
LLNNINSAVAERSPSPESPSADPKISFTLGSGGSGSLRMDEKAEGSQDGAPGREGTKAEAEEKMEETATLAEEEEFDWLPRTRKVSVASFADDPSVPDTDQGGGPKKKKKKGRK